MQTAQEIRAVQALRHRAFWSREGVDCDGFDAICVHVVIEEVATGRMVGCFRILPLVNGHEIARSYSAQYYDLGALARFDGAMVELGRFCIEPGVTDPDVLRVAWAALTRYVDDNKVEMLFGCSSFAGEREAPYRDAFALLKARHLAPAQWRPAVKAPAVFRYATRLRRKVDSKRANAQMPPLLRTYLMMGGWVSDHAVVDHAMNTLHVFTGLEIGAIPEGRKRLLRAVARDG